MMQKRNLVGMAAIAAVAFGAGRLQLLSGETSAAAAQDWKDVKGQAEKKSNKGVDDLKKRVNETLNPQEQGMDSTMAAWAEAGTPGPHHRHLDAMVGTWDGEWTMYTEPGATPMTWTGKVEREWVLDGRYLKEKVTADSPVGKFTGLGYMGYNKLNGQYEMIWMDSMSTAIFSQTGSFNPETHMMKMHGATRDPVTGKMITSSGKMDCSNSNMHTFVSYQTGPDGREFKHFEGKTTRR